MTREQATPYISFGVDDSGAMLDIEQITDNQLNRSRFIGWQCGFEPMFVAVWSLDRFTLEDHVAEEIAIEALEKRSWFSGNTKQADYFL